MSEMEKLISLLAKSKLPYEVGTLYKTTAIFCPSDYYCACEIACNAISYGHQLGLLQVTDTLYPSEEGIEGYLTAEQAFVRIQYYLGRGL
jgi:hypothetical protein